MVTNLYNFSFNTIAVEFDFFNTQKNIFFRSIRSLCLRFVEIVVTWLPSKSLLYASSLEVIALGIDTLSETDYDISSSATVLYYAIIKYKLKNWWKHSPVGSCCHSISRSPKLPLEFQLNN